MRLAGSAFLALVCALALPSTSLGQDLPAGQDAPVEGNDTRPFEAEPKPVSRITPEAQPGLVDLDLLVVPEVLPSKARNPLQDIRKLLRPEASLIEARNRLDRDIKARTLELANSKDLESRLTRDLDEKAAKFAAHTSEINRLRGQIRTRIDALVDSQRLPAFADWLSTRGNTQGPSYAELRNAREVLAIADRQHLNHYAKELERYRVQERDLERRRQNLERTRERIAQLEQELSWDLEERKALETAVVTEPEFYAAYAREIEELDAVISAKMVELAASSPADRRRLFFEETRGGMTAPIRNFELVGRYGTRSYKGIQSRWKGAHFVAQRTPKEGPVYARTIYWGYVAWTGWMPGLGQVVIIDHTLGYLSLYAHLDTIEAKVGDKLKSGDILGTVGDTESFFGPRLYLEIRKNGVAMDPLPWLRPQ